MFSKELFLKVFCDQKIFRQNFSHETFSLCQPSVIILLYLRFVTHMELAKNVVRALLLQDCGNIKIVKEIKQMNVT